MPRKITLVCADRNGEPFMLSGYGVVLEESRTERWGSREHELYIELHREGNDVHRL